MPSAPCLLKVSFVGCKTTFAPCRSVNDIRLESDTRLLKGVTVTNDRPIIEHRGGTLVANVAGTPLALTGSADELLSNLPMVTGEEGSYEVIGRGAAEVYINSRKVRDATELEAASSRRGAISGNNNEPGGALFFRNRRRHPPQDQAQERTGA